MMPTSAFRIVRTASLLLVVLLAVPILTPAQINIAVSGGLGDLDGDGNPGPEATVLQAAIGCWQARVLTNRNFTLTVQTANLSGGTIGQGAVSASDGSGIPTAGFITMDSPRTYFIDATPLLNEEFPNPDDLSQWRLLGGPGTDLFSVTIHEIGHALAWVCNTCGFPNPNFDALMNPAPGSFVSDPTCRAPFPRANQPQPAGCVRLQSGNPHPMNTPLRGDGLGGSGSAVVNELSHPGVTGDLMLGFYTGGAREMPSFDDVDVFFHAYGDTVNLPLSLDPGEDIVAECDSFGGSEVMLDATGTTDPENDPITYAWDCGTVTLSGATTSTPDGFFPVGQTITCRVDAGDQAACPPDADTVDVRVQDTTPPTIQCPDDVTVECTGNCGIEASDPQLADFFAGFGATDVCDSSVSLANDAPSFFNLGDTVVTFSATDDFGNQSTCQRTVTVQDTIPPVVEMELDRDTLWPPNHKMVEINAMVTVEDICDPDAGFVLTSITSNEPDDGLGDGDTPDDIQEAEIGTPDTQFLLRSERSGTGTGRVYTVIYTGSDKSGNTTEVSAEVRVPHDRRGGASASEGFNETGESFRRNVDSYTLVIFSTPLLDAATIHRTAAQVGNTYGVIDPVETRTVDFNCDGLLDLELRYPMDETLRLVHLTAGQEALAFRYEMEDGVGSLVPDIFGLGAPVTKQRCRPQPDRDTNVDPTRF